MLMKKLLSLLMLTVIFSSCDVLNFGSSKNEEIKPSNQQSTSSNVQSNSTIVNDENGYQKLTFNKTVQDLEYVAGALPSVGNPRALVIPVDFSDCTATSKGYSIDKIDMAFNGGDNDTGWESVNSYYYKSSYGKVDVQFDVMDSWFRAKNTSNYYENYTSNDGYTDPAELIIKEFLQANDKKMDFSIYDTNKDGFIDAVYVIYSHSIDRVNLNTIWWAYQYYYFAEDYYDGVSPYYYMFAGYDFLFDDNILNNAHTYIHESGHVFGLEDYYDYNEYEGATRGGLAGADMMDFTVGDHNPFSKMLLGWVSPKLITTKTSVTIDLEAFQENGDFVILANEWDSKKGMYQEYFIVEYWTPTGLNEFDSKGEYLYSLPGIRVLHINAELGYNSYNQYYFKYNNSDTKYKMIELVPANSAIITNSSSASNGFLYTPNKYHTFKDAKYSDGTKLNYSFVVNSLTDSHANITFTKI